MAEPESILQLGIEAAREGKKEEARQLFRLLTRQEPDNAQSWLWLAGVAENREERQSALERVVQLDPTNEMALKGLHALGVTARPAAPPPPPPPAAEPPPPPAAEPPPPPAAEPSPPPAAEPPPPPAARPPLEEEADPFGEDDPFAELNDLSAVLAADTSGPVRRAETAPATSASGTTAPDSGTTRQSLPPVERSPRRPRMATAVEEEPPRRGMSPLLALLLFLVGLGLVGLLIAFLFPNLFGGGEVANNGGAAQTAAAQTTVAVTPPVEGVPTVDPNAPVATVDPNAPVATVDPNAPVPTVDPNAPVPTVDPNAPVPTAVPAEPTAPPPAPTADVTAANPAIVSANTPLQSEGWLYDFNQPTFAASVIGNIGSFAPANGRFVVVLAYAVNGTGTDQPIPPNFFVLKDAQGRIWEARPDISDAYVVPGVNADLGHGQPFPADGITRSMPIVFDVAPDATNLVFFARSNPSQGWIILTSV